MLDNISILPAGHLKKTQNKILLKHPLTTVAQSTALVQRLGRSESCSVTILWVGRPPPSPVFSSPSQRTKSQHFSANKPDQQPETINSMRNQRGKEIAALLTTHTHTHRIRLPSVPQQPCAPWIGKTWPWGKSAQTCPERQWLQTFTQPKPINSKLCWSPFLST